MNHGPGVIDQSKKKRGRPSRLYKDASPSIPKPVAESIVPDAFQQSTSTVTDILDTNPMYTPEIQKDIYQRIIDLVVASDEEDVRLWEVCQALFEHALQQMNPTRQGLAITYARLMPPHKDGIHSLREAAMRGNPPWQQTTEAKIYLGSTSLAGTAAGLLRMQTWNDQTGHHVLAEVDEFEHSACAAPVSRGNSLAGVLIISSIWPDFFDNHKMCEMVVDYAKLLCVAIPDKEFQSLSLLNLRPMPCLSVQREEVIKTYRSRIISYVHAHELAHKEAEQQVQREMELEFEAMCVTE